MSAGFDRLLNAADVAALLDVPKSWVREHTRSGEIPHVELGRYVRYREADVREWVALCLRPSGGVATYKARKRRS